MPMTAPVVVTDVLPEGLQSAEAAGRLSGVGGIIGADWLSRQPVAFDPAGARIYFGDAANTRYTDAAGQCSF